MTAHASAPQLFGTAVKARRLELGVSQEAVAKLCGIHVTNLGKLERGVGNPALNTMLAVATALGTTIAALTQEIDGSSLPETKPVYSVDDFLAAKLEADEASRF